MSRVKVKSKARATHLEVGLDEKTLSYFGHEYRTVEGRSAHVGGLRQASSSDLRTWMESERADLDDPYTRYVYDKITLSQDPGDDRAPAWLKDLDT